MNTTKAPPAPKKPLPRPTREAVERQITILREIGADKETIAIAEKAAKAL